MTSFTLRKFDPLPLSRSGPLDGAAEANRGLIALDVQSKFLFVDERGETFHEYFVPGTPDVQNCGGYVDKVIKYRDPALAAHIEESGVSAETFAAPGFSILGTRSPRLDLLLYALILELRRMHPSSRVSMLDHGCTVGEHYDLLDIMLRAGTGNAIGAPEALSYCGLDKSLMLLNIAKLLHMNVPPQHFRLVQAEGSNFPFTDNEFDLSLSVGVVNHTAEPIRALENLLAATRYASVLALWVTSGEDGFWAINHSSVPQYFFSLADLRRILNKRGEGRFFSTEFVLETDASQLRSYVGLGEEKLKTLGSYHLVFTTLPSLPFEASELLL